ncbi:MAG: PQQ-dependent sugar dehydrogenase [Actinomycetota bacterium]|nr:PQQ-dependent sugar dehydrogenase [Actinomycetota bacterium]
MATRAVRGALVAVLLAGVLAGPASAAGVRLQRIGRFAQPVYVTSPPGAARTLIVVQRYGLIRAVRNGRVLRTPLADLRSRVLIEDPREEVDQRGLLSVAFAPDYAHSGRFDVDYVDRSGRLRVDELRRGRRGVRRVLDLGPASTQHHGGQLQFGRDGLLYVSTGMNDDPTTSQDPGRPGGKILRLDPRRPRAAPEVYASGLRNPWRFSFDRVTHSMLIADVGDATTEEIDVLAPGAPAGANFGWPAYEGTERREGPDVPGATAPALTMRHSDGWCAVTGGYVVRDRSLPALAGRYVYGDLCSGRVWSARLTGNRLVDVRPLASVYYPVSFGEDGLGRVYAVSFAGGVFRLRRA